MRGKDYSDFFNCCHHRGSPPLARERPSPRPLVAIKFRITPACAGKTGEDCFFPFYVKDHPRLRGKDCWRSLNASPRPGSPPLARERQTAPIGEEQHPGITPACAGKTCSDHYLTSIYRDHPRLRGKDLIGINNWLPDSGSPPLARERREFIVIVYSTLRITPACAGKTIILI